jgi:hypothetical protein
MPSFGNCSNSSGPAACVAESALDTANHLSDCFRFQTPIGYELSRFNFTIEHDVYTSRDSDLCRSDLVLLWRNGDADNQAIPRSEIWNSSTLETLSQSSTWRLFTFNPNPCR